ncbi:MAG: EAL domain-containing protein [Henriciella sp.]|uniref:EAL domain-containing protein n=1 Tax=Henriciella sp. TaxID=1968823 RepID=UPI0032EBECDF
MTTTDCGRCRNTPPADFAITMAFQPIIDSSTRSVFAYEALVRGAKGEGAGEVLSRVTEETRYSFDQQCRTTAIGQSVDLGMKTAAGKPFLSINFLPNAVYEPRACIRQTLAIAMQTGFPLDRIIFEFTEGQQIDTDHLLNILRVYRSMGFATAIDDFGAGYAGMNLLAEFQPDFVKLDMNLIRDIDQNQPKQVIVKGILDIAAQLGVRPICEGIETLAEFETLQSYGVELMQGYFFARPALDALPPIDWPEGQELKRAAM